MEFQKCSNEIKELYDANVLKNKIIKSNNYKEKIQYEKELSTLLAPILKSYFGVFYCEKNGFNKDGYFRRLNKLQLKDFSKTILRLDKEGNPVYALNC